MNIISNAPSWAQKTFTAFAAKQSVEGTEQSPITDEYKTEAREAIAGITLLASFDEQPGIDEAMGQPGVVKADDTTLYFEGRPDSLKAVLNSVVDETGSDATIYLATAPDGLHMIGLSKAADGIEIEGAVLTSRANGDFSGYQIAGKVS